MLCVTFKISVKTHSGFLFFFILLLMHFGGLDSMFSIHLNIHKKGISKRLKFNLITGKIFVTYSVKFLSTWPERNWEKCSNGRNRTWPCFGLRNVQYLWWLAHGFFAQCTLLYEYLYTLKCVKNREIAATYSSFIKCVWSPRYVGPALVKNL